MNRTERAHLRLLLDHRVSETRTIVAKQNDAMHSDHAGRRILQSGATVKAALAIAEELGERFVKEVFDDAASIAKQPDAFSMAFTEVTIVMGDMKAQIDRAVRLAALGPRMDSVAREAERLFLEVQQRTYRLAEIRRFEFNPRAAPLTTAKLPVLDMESPRTNRGGAPLAAHWDEMWADVAVQLWNGDLKPKRQKDISDAMFAWLVARDLDAGSTAVTARARALWTKLEPVLRG